MDNVRVIFLRTLDIEPEKDGYVWTIQWIAFMVDGSHRRTHLTTRTLIGYDDDAATTETKIAGSVKEAVANFATFKAVANTDIHFGAFTRGR